MPNTIPSSYGVAAYTVPAYSVPAGKVSAQTRKADQTKDQTLAETATPVKTQADTTVPVKTQADTTIPAKTQADTTIPVKTQADTTIPVKTQADTTTPVKTQATPSANTQTTPTANTQASSFLDMMKQANQRKINALVAGMGSMVGMSSLPTSLMLDLATMLSMGGMSTGGMSAGGWSTGGMSTGGWSTGGMSTGGISTGGLSTGGTGTVGTPSLEEMLRVKYPNIHYHVFDASSDYWKTRNDYPHYLLYQDGDMAKQTLENWEPTGDNPFYGSIDGRFNAPPAIHALGSVPPGSKAVVIHPKVQERMEQDPAYAQEIYAKIDMWFAFDVSRNEAILPGGTVGMSQAVAIGEDGNICNACSSSGGGGFTYSRSGSNDVESWWDRRVARHAEMLRLMLQHRQADKIQDSSLAAAAAARAQLAAMLNSSTLPAIFGDEISGVPTETILALTQAQVWGESAAIF